MSKITRLAISRKPVNQKKKKGASELHIFTPFCQFWGQNSILNISIRSRFIQLLVIWPNPTHWPTDPPNHPLTHPWVGVSLQILNLQTELNYLESVNNFLIFSDLTWPHPSTHQPTNPPNHTSTHGWGSLHRFQIFKRNWNILISSNAIEFWLIPGSPLGVGGMGGCGGGGERVPPTHMHIYAHAHTHTHAYMTS